ncbi:uncharacterized protein LOC116370076 isoform X2 [Oncorhynchus kisutch]|uniref:uncharacterized protein LOC116370076 isoform X2 n=1 Tax=Oncorhynchus kisutch TaxID=8019 RepID=UPI0012DE1AB8|nr:uncharacterized protein LOC116370076 isoform X2 [Oncorhynchus kisutch]
MGSHQVWWCSVALLCISTGVLIRTVGCPTEGGISPEPKGPMQAQSSGPEVNGNNRRSPKPKGPMQACSSGPEGDGNDRRSPEPKGPMQACSSGPEVDGNDRWSPEPKGPMQAYSSGPDVDGNDRMSPEHKGLTQASNSGPELDGNDRWSPEPKGPMQACSSGPEVDGNDRRSPEPKGPMQACSSGPEVDGNDRWSPAHKGLTQACSSGPEVDGNDRMSPEHKGLTQASSSGPEVDGNDRRSPEHKGLTQASNSGPEVDGNDRRSPEPKGPRSNGPEVDDHRRRTALLQPHKHEDNLFLSRAEMVANLPSKEKDCWVCGMGPVKVGAGLPLMGVPIGVNFTIALAGKIPFYTMTNNVKVYNQPNVSYYLRPGNVSMPPISVTGVMTAPWCIRGYGDHDLGELKCNCTMNLNGSNACNLTVIQENGQADKEPFKMWVDKHSTTLRGAPHGTYWLCGKMAYYSLPSNWGGTCTVGFVVTAMRTVPNNQRDLMALFRDYKLPGMRRDNVTHADVTHAQTPASRFFGVFFSGYGVACALDQIHDISRHIENIDNASRNSLEQLNGELKEMLKLSLQNREALDYLLAGQGGTCAIIGDKCCIFVLPDHSSNVTDLAEYIATAA